MAYKVVKFGGSNLKDVHGIRNIIQAVQNYNQNIVIVVSAFYGMTDQFIQAIDKSLEDTLDLDGFMEEVYNKKINALTGIVSDKALIVEFKNTLGERLAKLRDYYLGVKYIKEVPPFLYDEILSYGEKLSSLVLYYILKSSKIDCLEVLPESIGLITDGEFLNASVDFELSEKNLNSNLSESRTYIIPGFYGVSKDGRTTLLGRGGSDYSAAAIAACLNASSLDLWKDVKGFLSADPKIVQKTISINSLTYAEAGELAYFGSKILHPRTPEPLFKKGIPIRILNIDDSHQGIKPLTIINGDEIVNTSVIKSVSYSDNFGILKMQGSSVGIKPGILAKSTAKMDEEGINIKSVITSQTAINFLLSQDDLIKALKAIRKLDIHGVSNISSDSNISLIAAVGEGLSTRHGIAGRIFSAVARKGINVKIICFGASEVAMYFIVDQNDRNETIRTIHNEFFEVEYMSEL